MHEHLGSGAVATLAPEQLGTAGKALRRVAHDALQRAEDDYGRRTQFNTVVSRVHELVNAVRAFQPENDNDRAAVREALQFAMVILSPIAPHVTQALWESLGGKGLLVQSEWPAHDEAALVLEVMKLVVQVNGKVRATIEVPSAVDEAAAQQAALDDENVQRFLADKTLRKAIYVPGKLVNLVVSG
ncbi:MAG: class I tRNA ligase family protein [Pseudomonadales bacterium]